MLPALNSGGVERGTIDIARTLCDAGWQALVASSGGRMVRDLDRLGVPHVTLPLETKNPIAIYRNAEALADLIRREGVDLVHVRSRAPAWSVELACKQTDTPWIATFHGTYGLGLMGLKKLYNSVMLRGRRVIAVSHFIARHLFHHYAVSPEKVAIIPRGVDVVRFDPETVNAERMIRLSNAWRLPDDAPVIMLPARLSDWKGHGLLLDALHLMRGFEGAPKAFRCLFVGDTAGRGAFRAELEEKAAALGLSDAVQFVDNCDDMPAAYMVTDVVVSASTRPEAFGRVVAEAQAMGRLTVAPRHGAAPEIVQDGITGWLFEPNTPISLARALHRALSADAATRAAVARRARASVAQEFTLAGMGAATLSVYAEVLTSTGRAAYAAGIAPASAVAGPEAAPVREAVR